MINDLFSHKIHSSRDEWPEKLAELAAIFGEFDGELFDRAVFEERLQLISPRASYLAQEAVSKSRADGLRLDVSKFRDEISAYPSYLGLYFLEQSPSGWVVRVSETTKRFLLIEEPDVGAFLRLQLPLFQYPNAMGASYTSRTNNLRIQANARDRTLDFIKQGIHFSPVRLISIALKADAELRGINLLEGSISFVEIFGLANCYEVNQTARPDLENVTLALENIRCGVGNLPPKYESRFHTLRHTEMFNVQKGRIGLRKAINEEDGYILNKQLNAVCAIENQFNDFDSCTSGSDIELVIGGGSWGRYFDGVEILQSHIVDTLTTDKKLDTGITNLITDKPIPSPSAEVYSFRERTTKLSPVRPYDRSREIADPELTKIKRQRRNLAHKELIDKMDSWLRQIGAIPKENDHIDLFAKIPSDGSFIFEMKSGGENLLEQVRKGLSQLYEYRYRYKEKINDPHISLCLVLPEMPDSIPWIIDYLCIDRGISVCWFNNVGELKWPDICSNAMQYLRVRQL